MSTEAGGNMSAMEGTSTSRMRNETKHGENVRLIRIFRAGKAVDENDPIGRRRKLAGERALEELLRRNTTLVWHVIERYGYGKGPGEDLHAAGMLGLLKGIEKYDEAFGCTLATYASWWIRQAVGREVQRLNRESRLGVFETLEISGEDGREREIPAKWAGVEAEVEAGMFSRQLEQGILELGAEEREVLLAWMRNDGNLPAAARESEIDQVKARQRLYAAWSKLQHPTNRHSLLTVEWEEAACRGGDQAVYFPGRGRGRGETQCGGCVVQERCLNTALTDARLLGIWGGTGEGERKEMRRRQREEPSQT